MKKPNSYRSLELARKRYSPYGFDASKIELAKLMPAFEAMGWAPSAYNNQPWRLILAERDTPGFEGILEHAVPANQYWMQHASIIGATCYKTTLDYKEKPDPTAAFAAGQSVGNLLMTLTEMGIDAHQAGGFDYDGLAQHIHLPDNHAIGAMIAIGRAGKGPETSPELVEKNDVERIRKPVSDWLKNVADEWTW